MTNSWLQHFGIQGMKWGVRRFRNKDGTLTDAGKRRYLNSNTGRLTRKGAKTFFNGKDTEFNEEGRNQMRYEKRGSDVQRSMHNERKLRRYNKYAGDAFIEAVQKFSDGAEKFESDWIKKHGRGSVGNVKYVTAIGKYWSSCFADANIKKIGLDYDNGKEWVKDLPLYNMEMFVNSVNIDVKE